MRAPRQMAWVASAVLVTSSALLMTSPALAVSVTRPPGPALAPPPPATTLAPTTPDPRAFDHSELGSCNIPLGMESGRIPNDALSASSSYDQSVSPLSARLRVELKGGAWCANGLIRPKSREYLQVDLDKEYLITATETQGRFANGIGVEFVEFYTLEYWRAELNHWTKYKDFNGTRLIPGNKNTYVSQKSVFDAPFVASKVRFFPHASHPRTACMRVELYGCLWKRRYKRNLSIPMRSDNEAFCEEGVVSYTAPLGSIMRAMAGGAVFADVSYDGITRNSRLFNGLGQLTDSLYGPNDFEFEDPYDNTGTRWVGWNRTSIGGSVEIQFNFNTSRRFISTSVHCNNMFTKDVQLFKTAEIFFSLEGVRWQEDTIIYEPKQDKVSEDARTMFIELKDRIAQHVMFRLYFQHEWILMSEIVFNSVPIEINRTQAFIDEYYKTEMPPTIRKKKINTNLRVSIGLACGGLVGFALCAGIITMVLTKRAKRNGNAPPIAKKPIVPRSQSRNSRRPPRFAGPIQILSRPAVVDDDYREPYNIWKDSIDHLEKDNGSQSPEQNEYNEICEVNDIHHSFFRRPDLREPFYAATDIIHQSYMDEPRARREQHLTPGLFTSIKLPEADPPNGVAPLLDFPRGRMRNQQTLGEGPYGTIQKCETDAIEGLSDEESDVDARRRRRIVIVKTLWRGCNNSVVAAFAREATWGAGLKHPQLARVLGLSMREPPCAAVDRGDALDLPALLHANSTLSYGSLIHICCQIAAGMKYLESFELVHRDLAARNVTVTKNLDVKIADYAMFMDEHKADYYLSDTNSRLPIRWMSWESLLMGVYSPSSDVWSFGVTIWEIVTLCSAKPFDEMTDEQVIENADGWRRRQNNARVPAAPPPRCRRELHDLMHECWRREPHLRPRFLEIHRFLDRMSHGFKPPAKN